MSVVTSVHGVLGPLLGKLADLLTGNFDCLRGVHKDIISLQYKLTSMHVTLQEYMMLEDLGVHVNAWISLLWELTYDTYDLIDKFIRHLGKHTRHGNLKEFFRDTTRFLKMLNSRYGITDQIDELKARIKNVKELKDSYKLGKAPKIGHVVVDLRLSAMFAEESHLVGMEDPRDDLVKWILEEGKDRRVL